MTRSRDSASELEPSWEQVRRLFESVVELDDDERSRVLRQQGVLRPRLAARVRSLLDRAQVEATELDRGALGLLQDLEHEGHDHESTHELDLTGRVAASYHLRERIAWGGMGEVWLAAREFGATQRLVAVKVLKRGLHTDALLRRFRTEQEALAALQHEHIVAFLDAGSLPDGRPFLMMEHVDGSSITDYCDRHQLSLSQRLELFVTVCGAVQFAHSRLLLHRDLKPSNILVSTAGTPKLLDFGMAKLLRPAASGDMTELVHGAAWTPNYASPEQIHGQPVSVATDVYGLGLVLYELLVGRPAFEHRTLASLMAATKDELEVVPPSVAAAKTSSVQSSAVLARNLRGDLDAVVLKALATKPQHRYPSVEAFAADVGRYLAGEFVTARRGTFIEHGRKWLRRNRGVAVGAALVSLALTTAWFGTWLGMQRAQVDASRGWGAHAESRRATRFLEEVLLDQSRGDFDAHRIEARVTSELSAYPEAEALVRIALGHQALASGNFPLAKIHLQRAIDIGSSDAALGIREKNRAAELLAKASELESPRE